MENNPITSSSQLVVMTIEDFKRMLQELVEATLQKERAYEKVTEITDDSHAQLHLIIAIVAVAAHLAQSMIASKNEQLFY